MVQSHTPYHFPHYAVILDLKYEELGELEARPNDLMAQHDPRKFQYQFMVSCTENYILFYCFYFTQITSIPKTARIMKTSSLLIRLLLNLFKLFLNVSYL